jgi:predicted regulator of Ras-like GTPase activity (Roadblock/LC7/MglB family)
LAIINKSGANIGLINLDAKETAEKITQVLG